MAAKPQVPITEQKFITLPTEMEEPVEELKDRILDLFEMIDDDDINLARKVWREINTTLIQAFTMGVYDMVCSDCGTKWAVARRQALNEQISYRSRNKLCPECSSTNIGLDFEFQLAIHDMERLQITDADDRRRTRIQKVSDLAPGEAEAAAEAAFSAPNTAEPAATETAETE
ncbi:MAG: hypothetical protein LBN43_02315 [Oscillospiraceae bacterium]|jgi:hypothetical protein|nr:hypothetical protein [Oscillospiraceae bacterium]